MKYKTWVAPLLGIFLRTKSLEKEKKDQHPAVLKPTTSWFFAHNALAEHYVTTIAVVILMSLLRFPRPWGKPGIFLVFAHVFSQNQHLRTLCCSAPTLMKWKCCQMNSKSVLTNWKLIKQHLMSFRLKTLRIDKTTKKVIEQNFKTRRIQPNLVSWNFLNRLMLRREARRAQTV